MIRAALDTSTSVATFALERDGELLVQVQRECRRGASKLLPWIIELIREQGIRPAEINEWFVGKGPGSFTGLRVGLSFVKGSCETGGRCLGVNSGYAYLGAVLKNSPECDKIKVIHDGRKRELIINSFEKCDGLWKEAGIEVISIDDLKATEDCQLVTVMTADSFSEELQQSITFIESPDAACYFGSGLEVPEDKQAQDESCEPVYVRPAVFVKPLSQRG